MLTKQLHHRVFAVLPVGRVSSVVFAVPVPDHAGLRFALHSHVFVSLCAANMSSADLRRSLVTGSSSHKAVTSDVSRILWYYYNDSVRLQTSRTKSTMVLCDGFLRLPLS